MAGAGTIRAGKAAVELGITDRFSKALRSAQRRLQSFGKAARNIGYRMSAAGVAASAGFALSARVFAGFDDQMRAVRAVTGATESDFVSLTEEAKRLGRTTSFTAAQVAMAMKELGRAGFRPKQILDSTEAVLALSRATETELPMAAAIAGAAMRGFNIDASEMGRVSDVLTATANGSAQTLEDLAEALKPVAPIAVEAGESLEGTAAAIGVLANNGIRGSLAGNALARAYKNLANTATQAELAKIGVTAVDSANNLRPLADIINDLAKSTANMGTAQKLSIFETLFGRGQAAALKLASSGTAFDEIRSQIERSAGVAVRTAEEMDAGLGGSFRKTLSALEGIAIAIGEAIQGPVMKAADAISRVAGYVTQLISHNKKLVAGIAIGIGVFTAAGFALISLGVAAMATGMAIGGMVSIAGLAASVLGAIISPVGILTAGVVGLGAAILKWSGIGGQALGWLGQKFGELGQFAREVFQSISTAMARGDMTAAADVMWAALEVAWRTGTSKLLGIWERVKLGFLKVTNQLTAGIQSAFVIVLDKLGVDWVEFFAFIQRTMTRFKSGFKSAWETVTSFVAKKIVDIQGLADDSLDTDAIKAEIDRESNNRKQEIAYERDASLREIEQRRRDRKGESIDEALARIERESQARIDEMEGQSRTRISDAQTRLEEAKARLQEAIQIAKGPEFAAGGGQDFSRLAASVDDLLAGSSEVDSRTGPGASGTFSAFSAASLFKGTPTEKKIEKNTESTVTQLKALKRAIEKSGGLVFLP